MASRSEPGPHDAPDELARSDHGGAGTGSARAARNHEELLRDRRAALRQDQSAVGAAELSRHVLDWARCLDAGERTLREALRDGAARPDAAGPDAAGPGGSEVPVADARALGRAAALLGAAEAAAVLAARSAHTLTAESSVTTTMVSALVPALVAESTAGLGRPVAERTPDSERLRGAVVAQFPWLVHAFAAEEADEAGLAEAVRLGEPLVEVDPSRLNSLSRGGCSPIQALPRLVAGPALGTAPAEVQDLAKSVLAVGDELHRRMAEVPDEPRSTATDRQLAAAYETLYAAAACLGLWAAGAAVGELWLRAALRALLVRLHRLLGEEPPALAPQPAEELLAAGLTAEGPLLPF
ncbi:hypothetical protein ACIRD3_24550 [Kitasatospora sp. NPDC093550]|uniref:hypothetical protein n=1 Tax=Kitasatospora sp. NPDC093550 TaxID=3364089 RepID=UPI003805F919